jgi:hypothetical protein
MYTIDNNHVNQPAAESSSIVVPLESDKEVQFLPVSAGNWKCHSDSGKVTVMSRRLGDAALP